MADRRFRIDDEDQQQLAPGWWRFRVDGRRAVPLEPSPPADLAALPAVRGHFVSGWVVVDGRQLHRIALPPADEPAPLSRVVCRRWHSGDLLFDTTEFEDDAELAARTALEERRPLGDTKGVVPSLRAAFGYAVGLDVARELDIAVTPRELAAHVVAIAEGGRDVATRPFDAILEARRREAEEAQRRIEEANRRLAAAQREAEEARRAERLEHAGRHARSLDRHRHPLRRADDTLEQAGARMIVARFLENRTQLDVTYEVDGTRILSIVDAATLQVLDPGICLSGAHRVLTLDAMPSVVREAIEDGVLNITRRS
jgi:hypothetical protein